MNLELDMAGQVPEVSEPQSTQHTDGEHVLVSYSGAPRGTLLFDVPVPQRPPRGLLLAVEMTFGGGFVSVRAVEMDISAAADSVQEALHGLAARIRRRLESLSGGEPQSRYTALLQYPPYSWFKAVRIVAGNPSARIGIEENALYDFEVPDLDALAEAQGVAPIGDIDELVADFWPEDERIEDFMAAVRRWRDEGSRRHD